MLSRRLLLLATAVMALALPARALAIVNGETVAPGDYPAHGFLGIDTTATPDGHIDAICGGTLVGSRQFLTAARCVTNTLGTPRAVNRLTVRVGDVALPDDTVVQNVAANDIPDAAEPPGAYVRSTGENDVAMLTLTAPLDTELMRVVDLGETAAWAPGTVGRILGWGETSQGGDITDTLLKGDVTIRADEDCPDPDFDPAVMLCAAGTPATGDQNPCMFDSGSPLLVPDGAVYALAGVFSGAACGTADEPGVFTRLGDDPLNKWVHDRTPEANFAFESGKQPQATVPFALIATPDHPEGDDYFTAFKWDLDGDGVFDDASGRRIVMTVGAPGEAVVGIQASKPAAGSEPKGDTASAYFAFDVLDAPTMGQPTPPGPPAVAATPTPTANPVARSPLATILNARRPKVRRGRFPIRIRFADSAPAGTAVIEVYRGARRIGIARTKVRPGATKRVRVKLTPTGRRMLRRADGRRLKVRVRVRVGRKLLRTKQLTIRR
jgi:hypothetical protein